MIYWAGGLRLYLTVSPRAVIVSDDFLATGQLAHVLCGSLYFFYSSFMSPYQDELGQYLYVFIHAESNLF